MESGLNVHAAHRIVWLMSTPPIITDRPALLRNRARAIEPLLQTIARDEIQDRLGMVNRSFTTPVMITGFPDLWSKLVADAAIIPDEDVLDLSESSSDLIVHALSLHWANDPVGQLIQCRRALLPDGLFLAIAFGGQTLHELRSALATAESEVSGGLSPRVLPMADIREMGALLQRAGFALPVADCVTVKLTYKTARHLMQDLRAMGENNALHARRKVPTRRSVLLRAMEIYAAEHSAPDGRVSATFEMIVLTGWAPHASQQQPLRPGSAIARLSDALSVEEKPLSD
jgi:SAM-dependent methyltransferase